jgi:hypothetical protein
MGMTSDHHDPYELGYICATMEMTAVYLRVQTKSFPGMDHLLKFEDVKQESPVIANQPSCGEQVLEFCTNRPSRPGSVPALSGGGG